MPLQKLNKKTLCICLCRLSLLLLLCTIANYSFSQICSGIVKSKDGGSIPNATVALLRAKDSSLVKLSLTGAAGNFSFMPGPGKFLVLVSHIEHKKKYSSVFELAALQNYTLGEIVLDKTSATLSGITVTAQRPMIEVKPDKTILNVEGTINATGSNVLDLLKKSPGITVDNEDNIGMNGRNAVQVFIDGKASPLSPADLAAYLHSMQSAQVESIELISNPPAKYDAAGNGGIINIKLKKNKSIGINIAISQGYAIGTYSKYNTGIAINYRNKKLNVFTNYNFNKAINVTDFFQQRQIGDSAFHLHSIRKTYEATNSFNTGADFFIDKKNTIGILINGSISNTRPENYSVTPISYIPTSIVDRILIADNSAVRQIINTNFNGNYHYTGSKGREFNLDADYGLFRNKNNQFQPNAYYKATTGAYLGNTDFRFISPSQIDIYSLKADYEQNIGKAKLSFGAKFSYVKSNNHFEQYNVSGITMQLDAHRSNQFSYSENINAVYTSYNRAFKHTLLQLGIRAEQTTSSGKTYGLLSDGTINYNTIQYFQRQYLNLFPNLSVTFNKSKLLTWNINFNRRLDRPRYDYLNPFEYRLDVYTYRKGNPNLLPQYSNTITITNIYKNKLASKFSYGYIKDVFAQIIDTLETSKNFITNKNLASQQITNLNISYPLTIKQYTAFFNCNGFYSAYKANFGGGNRTINLTVLACSFSVQNTLKLAHGYTAELSGNYNSPAIWQGTFTSSRTWNADAGIQKQILKGKANIKAVITDIFYTQNPTLTGNFAGQIVATTPNAESRQFKLNFTYRFGNIQLKAARTRSAGADEEIKRTRSGG